MFKRGACLLLSGPSGAGKSTLIGELLREFDDIYFSISTTTRKRREGEVEGRDYYFVSPQEFREGIEKGLFLEWAEVHGNYYGTSLQPVLQALEEGKLVLFDIDVQGFLSVKKSPIASVTTSVFITPPSLEELKRRLEERGSDDPATIERRLENARREIEYMGEYDYILVNDDLERSRREIVAFGTVARLKRDREEVEAFIERWIHTH
ncbi:MAG: guanylate kinase [Epsilonproteobacteria bacterium]|nr:guanylate kinase [Campylobacterota bacterium]NPA56811.1 guanylate kinase [Campylobacterota bacterium]